MSSINGSSSVGGSSSSAAATSAAAAASTAGMKTTTTTTSKQMSIKNMTKWDVGQTIKWLRKTGFGDCERYFREHKINGRALLMLDEDDLKEVVRDNVGQRKNLFHLIKTMQLKYRNYVHSSSFEDDDSDDDDDDDEDEKKSNNSNSKEDNDNDDDDDDDEELVENDDNEEQSDKESLADDEADREEKTKKNKTKESRRKDNGNGGIRNGYKKKTTTKSNNNRISEDDGAKTSDDDADAERMLKNSSFIRNKVKLGAGLDLRNRGSSSWKTHHRGSGRRGSPHQSQNSSFYESPNGHLNHHHHYHHHHNDDDNDDIIIDTNLSHDLCDSCAKKLDYSIMNGGGGLASMSSSHHNMMNGNGGEMMSPLRSYRGEKRKTFLAVVYLFVTCLWTSFMLTVVHDRVPDMEKYPPLPDIILDNVPLIPWAFFATECIGLVLGLILLIILVMHKYRWIIFRRMCSLGSTIFFLRSITMLITSLSVPGVHIQCSSQRYGSLMNKLYGAWTILSGVGLYVQGVRTCGDYMFSGHTVWLTLLTHFITEYTPSSMNWLHTFTWVLNVFGLFFILGAHEHYSIDVFIAFYISSRLFLYYHSLANNKVLFQGDHKRVKIWFPLFSYFESNIRAIVPNEFEWPPNFLYRGYRSARNKFRKALYGGNGKTKTSNKSPLSNLSCQTNS